MVARNNIPRRAAVGIRAHSGWAALVAVAGDVRKPEVLHRQRIVVVNPEVRGASQPYHFAKALGLKEAEAYLGRCAAISQDLALKASQAAANALRDRGYQLVGCAIVLASGRPVPALAETLASHALIHTAEGEFFRSIFRHAAERMGLPVLGIRERELFDRVEVDLEVSPAKLKRQLADLGHSLGPPWTQDQKSAALAGWLMLASQPKTRPQRRSR